MINETFEEYWHRLKETELKKDPARVDTKYQCRLAWNARGEVEQKKIDAFEEKLKIRDSYIINFIENWNYLRGVLSNVSKEEGKEFDDCYASEFVEAKEFSEAFAMNTFREWLDIEKTEYLIKTLEEHESFKDIFWNEKLEEREGEE